jgi:Domain of unknown function DUF302
MSIKTLGAALLPLVFAAGVARADGPNELFWVKPSAKSPEQVVAAIKRYVEDRKWLYLAEFKVKGGQVTAVKICNPAVGKDVFAAGTHVAAMMPCGNLAVYDEGGTKVAMLHPKFMTVLNPDPNLERAVRELAPLFESMLAEVAN